MNIGDWVYCSDGQGFQHEKNGVISNRKRYFKKNSVGEIEYISNDFISVWLIGIDQIWNIPINGVSLVNVTETGDKFIQKICNICHCLLSVEKFAKNQNNIHGIVRRPSCSDCRTDIDKRSSKTSHAKKMEKARPHRKAHLLSVQFVRSGLSLG